MVELRAARKVELVRLGSYRWAVLSNSWLQYADPGESLQTS